MAGVSILGFPGAWNQVDSQNVGFGLTGQMPPDVALEEQALNRKQQLANILFQRALQPMQGEMVGNLYSPPTWSQGLAQLASAGLGAYLTHKNEQGRKELADRSNGMLSTALQNFQQQTAPTTMQTEGPGAPQPTGLQPGEGYTPEELKQPTALYGTKQEALNALYDARTPAFFQEGPKPTTEIPKTPEERQAALVQLMASQHPQAKAIGQLLMQQEAAKEEKASQREFTAQQNELNRDVQREKMSSQLDQMVMLKLMTQQQADEMRAKMDQQAQLNRENALAIAKVGAGSREKAAEIKAQQAENKPMPASAAQRQAEHLDAIGTAAAIKSDLSALRNQVDSGKINLGFVSNWLSRGKNAAGFSDEQSRNFSSFVNTLEKMRNDSLRLNKGVQTEGDAQRAWNELFQSINDPGLVKQRLQEIESINDRAVNLQKLQVDTLRENFKQPPFDFSKYETQPPAVGQGAAPSTGGWSIRPIQ